MANEINIYQPRYLAEVVRQAPAVHTFFRDMFFKNVKTFATERVDIDIVKGDRRMAAFVHPRAGGQVLEEKDLRRRATSPLLSILTTLQPQISSWTDCPEKIFTAA